MKQELVVDFSYIEALDLKIFAKYSERSMKVVNETILMKNFEFISKMKKEMNSASSEMKELIKELIDSMPPKAGKKQKEAVKDRALTFVDEKTWLDQGGY